VFGDWHRDLVACDALNAGRSADCHALPLNTGRWATKVLQMGIRGKTTAVAAIALVAIVTLSCYARADAAPMFAAGVQVGTIQNSSIQEASGIAASRRNTNVLWAHNDSGDTARVFAMTAAGTNLGTYSLSGASAIDWEDIAIGPGPTAGSQYLYLGDIGDNNAVRASISVYRVAEPAVSATQSPVTTSLTGVERLRFTYPDGPRDAESLFADPLTRDIYILTKRENPHRLYRAAYPQATSGTTVLEFVEDYADPNWLTAADISPDGDEIITRAVGSTSGRLFLRPPGTTIAAALNSTPITIPLRSEPQGEAIGFDPSGWGYYTISEGASQPIYYFNRVAEPGDFNKDGVVDAADYVALRKNGFAQTTYNTWQTNFDGRSSSGGGSLFSSDGTLQPAVPEPAGVILLLIASATIASRRVRSGLSLRATSK
jgi:hypothetical protein